MKKLYLYLILIALSAMASSCTITRDKCNQLYPPVVTHSTDTILLVRETILHDTTYIAPDNSELEIWLESDSNNDVQVTQSKTKGGKRSNVEFTTQRNNKVLKAMFECHCDSLNIYHVFKQMDTSLTVRNTETKTYQVNVPAQLTWWQAFKVAYGGYSLGAHAALLLSLIGYAAWKIFSVATPQGAAISGGWTVLGWIRKLFKR